MQLAAAQEALSQYFGYKEFRPMQAEIIQVVYERKDALVLMPTGGGKSICFQIPAITMPGTAVVVSPLISLMKDQVEALRANGIKAAFLNSSLTSNEQIAVEEEFFAGELHLLYVSPEKICSSNFLPLLQRAKVGLFAIDEAHCVSAWGHDFRPEYTQLKFLKQQFPKVPVIALTATADRLTRQDIVKQLGLAEPEIFIASFDRPNLSLEVRPGQRKKEQIIRFVKERPDQSGIVYCLSRKSTEKLANDLREAGITAAAYHAGMSSDERASVQEDFIKDETPVICATIAFGMGIDKSNVRWVIHYNLPKNLENYYQEIGRAGRDGAPADTLLFYSFSDVMLMTNIINDNDSENREVQLAKLDRIRQYAESVACRRRLLLNYFNENLTDNCGNCDICRNPPKAFDGTVLAQKALSAVYRLRESVGMTTLIDVLRGSGKQELRDKGYDRIKTFGAGRDLSNGVWQNYLFQLVNLGFLDIAYEEYGAVKLTEASKRVLFEKESVELVRLATLKERRDQEKAKAKQKTKRERVRDDLFEKLRQLRRRLAQEKGVPPYIIFSDKTLEEMAAAKPVSDVQMAQISGVGERKLHLYGDVFMAEILAFLGQKGNAPQGGTQKITLELYRKGRSMEQIALERDLSLSTVYSHLASCYLAGEELTINDFVDAAQMEAVREAVPYLEKPVQLRALFEMLDGTVSYDVLRMALAHLQREGSPSNDLFN